MKKVKPDRLVDEEKIIEAFLNQDSVVLNQVYQHLLPKVKMYILRNSGNQQDAEDIMNEAFMTVYTHILSNKYSPTGKFEPFFMIICRNIWLKKLRKKKYQSDQEIENIAISETPNEDIEQMIEEEQLIQRILTELKNLDPKCSQLLNMFYYEKKRLREIADNFGWTEKFAKNKKSRCMKALKKLVGV